MVSAGCSKSTIGEYAASDGSGLISFVMPARSGRGSVLAYSTAQRTWRGGISPSASSAPVPSMTTSKRARQCSKASSVGSMAGSAIGCSTSEPTRSNARRQSARLNRSTSCRISRWAAMRRATGLSSSWPWSKPTVTAVRSLRWRDAIAPSSAESMPPLRNDAGRSECSRRRRTLLVRCASSLSSATAKSCGAASSGSGPAIGRTSMPRGDQHTRCPACTACTSS